MISIALSISSLVVVVSAQSFSENGFDKVMVIGGDDGDDLTGFSVEVIDLLSTKKCATKVPDFPHLLGASGGFIKGRAVVCGGTKFFAVCKPLLFSVMT